MVASGAARRQKHTWFKLVTSPCFRLQPGGVDISTVPLIVSARLFQGDGGTRSLSCLRRRASERLATAVFLLLLLQIFLPGGLAHRWPLPRLAHWDVPLFVHIAGGAKQSEIGAKGCIEIMPKPN